MGSAAPASAPMIDRSPDPVASPTSPPIAETPISLVRDVPRDTATATVPEPVTQPTLVAQPAPVEQLPAEIKAVAVETPPATDVERVQAAILQALSDNNQRILVSMLSDGQWSIEGNEVVIRIAESQTIIDMSMSSDAKRIAVAAASGVLGRPAKLKVIPGANVSPPEKKNGSKFASGPGRPRSRRAGPGSPPHAGKIRCRDSHGH